MIRPIAEADRPRLRRQLEADWGSSRMATRGRLLDVATLPGFVAEDDGEWLGYSTYDSGHEGLEIAVLESLAQGGGVGVALLAACVAAARESGCSRVWLITTNDNTHALRFYQRRGFVLVALHRDAVTRARAELKPEIPELGNDDIPIRDELELELPREEWPDFVKAHTWPIS